VTTADEFFAVRCRGRAIKSAARPTQFRLPDVASVRVLAALPALNTNRVHLCPTSTSRRQRRDQLLVDPRGAVVGVRPRFDGDPTFCALLDADAGRRARHRDRLSTSPR
jgi:hypothetical protein